MKKHLLLLAAMALFASPAAFADNNDESSLGNPAAAAQDDQEPAKAGIWVKSGRPSVTLSVLAVGAACL